MLDFSILPASPQENAPTLCSSNVLTSSVTLRNHHVPHKLNYLGLNIHRPEPTQHRVTTGGPARPNTCIVVSKRSGEVIGQNDNEKEKKETIQELGRELDETLSEIEDKIGELAKLNGNPGPKCVMSRRFVSMSDKRAFTKYRDHEKDSYQTKSNPVSGEGSGSKLASLLETSFQITERVMRKAKSVSTVVSANRDDDIWHNSLLYQPDSCSNNSPETYSSTVTTKDTDGTTVNPLLTVFTADTGRNKKSTEYDTSISKIEMFTPKRPGKLGSETEDLDSNTSDESAVLSLHTDSPISCCFKESETSVMTQLQAHPLENLFRDRRKSTKKKDKSWRGRGVLRLLDCQRKVRKYGNTAITSGTDSEHNNRVLTAFINRRRSANMDAINVPGLEFEQTQDSVQHMAPQASTERRHSVQHMATQASTERRHSVQRMAPQASTERRHSVQRMAPQASTERRHSVQRMVPQASTEWRHENHARSSKQRILQTLRFKKGLISVSSLKTYCDIQL